MAVPKQKNPSRRPKKDAGSPSPTGPVGGRDMIEDPSCGHSGCGRTCQVRYCGPTTHMRDHHIVHAARGAAHVWTAAIVAGLAIVLTGAIAYTAVEAQTPSTATMLNRILNELRDLRKRVDAMDATLKGMNDRCTTQAKECRKPDDQAQCVDRCKEQGGDEKEIQACIESCRPEKKPESTCEEQCRADAASTTSAAGTDLEACLKSCKKSPTEPNQ